MTRFRVASLFSGGGGTDIGFAGGFDFLGRHYDSNNADIVYANDIEINANRMFEANFDLKPDSRNIREVNSFDIPEFDIRVVATGAHLSPEFGLTYKEIEQDGINIDAKIVGHVEDDKTNKLTICLFIQVWNFIF